MNSFQTAKLLTKYTILVLGFACVMLCVQKDWIYEDSILGFSITIMHHLNHFATTLTHVVSQPAYWPDIAPRIF